MKKKQVSLKKLTLNKQVISKLDRKHILGGGTFFRCSDDNPIPPIDVTLNAGCQFDTVGCPGPSDGGTCDWVTNCICDSIVTCQVC
ncbi:class I lanthipeptide [Taibaiella koreensis]|uniref:class I lanthipeptide n=1 Tax=Taibaiella koreensis TaxID=1268548 RepID=UPI000E59C5A9|nr:class I lanthipeptide [Taibaiella koreensis]